MLASRSERTAAAPAFFYRNNRQSASGLDPKVLHRPHLSAIMVPTVPAMGGVPAGPELLIIVILFAFLLLPVVAIAIVVLLLRTRSDGDDDAERIAKLEADVERLQETVEELQQEELNDE
ncbi:hypothetical protein JCM18237_27060 [Halorubrum luteum]